MYVLVGVVLPLVLPARYLLVGMMPSDCVACYVCAGRCGDTHFCCPLCMYWWVWCHPLVLAVRYVPVRVVPPPCVARYVCASVVMPPPYVARLVCDGWCGATPLYCSLWMSWLMCCHPHVLLTMYVLVGVV